MKSGKNSESNQKTSICAGNMVRIDGKRINVQASTRRIRESESYGGSNGRKE